MTGGQLSTLLVHYCSVLLYAAQAGSAVSIAFTVVRNIAKRKAVSTTCNTPAPGSGDVDRLTGAGQSPFQSYFP